MSIRLTLARLPGFGRVQDVSPPMGIASIAGHLLSSNLRRGLDIQIVDMLPLRVNQSQCTELLLRTQPDVIGLSYLTLQADEANSIIKEIKATSAKTVVIVGGNHATALYSESLEAGADSVIVGEGEQRMLEILTGLLDGKAIPKVSCAHNHSSLLPPELIPSPAWHLVDLSAGYNETAHFDHHPCMPVMASRGCWGDCTFCGSPDMWLRRVRHRPVHSVIKEINVVRTQFGYSRIHFYDDDFLANRVYAVELCSELNNYCSGILWTCLATVRSILRNRDVLTTLHAAGCRGVEFGFESADPVVLSLIGKRQNTGEVAEAVELLRRTGIAYIDPLTMLFNQGETPSSLRLELEFFLGIGMPVQSIANHQFATPYPGTALSLRARQIGTIYATKWADYRSDHVSFLPNSFLDAKPSLVPSAVDWRDRAVRSLNWDRAVGLLTSEVDTLTSIYGQIAPEAQDIRYLGHQMSAQTGIHPSKTVRAAALLSLLAIYETLGVLHSHGESPA